MHSTGQSMESMLAFCKCHAISSATDITYDSVL